MIKISFEGYSQFLCKNGHHWTKDAHLLMYETIRDQKCPVCGEPAAWENMVDLTNGSFDDEGNRIDGYIDLEPLEIHMMTCSNCDNTKACKCSTYKIPEDEE